MKKYTLVFLLLSNFIQAQNYSLLIPNDKPLPQWLRNYYDNVESKYASHGPYSDGLFAVRCNKGNHAGKYGYCDTLCKIIIPCKYDIARNFSGGMAPVAIKFKDGSYKWYLINKEGEIIYNLDYEYPEEFLYNRSIVMMKYGENRKFGAINRKGELVIPLNFNNIYNFSEGYAAASFNVKNEYGNETEVFGYIDTMGNIINKINLNEANSFTNGYGLAKYQNKYIFINKKGEHAFSDSFDYARDFQQGFAIVKKGKSWSYLDTCGQLIGNFDSISGSQVFRNKKMTYFAKQLNCLTDFFDYVFVFDDYILIRDSMKIAYWADGKVKSNWYDGYFNFYNNVAVVEKNKKYGILNKDGKIISDWFDYLNGFYFDTITVARISDKYVFVSISGKVLYDQSFESADIFYFNRALVKQNEEKFYIDRQAKRIQTGDLIPVNSFSEGLACVMNKKEQYGFIDTTGKLVVPCKFSEEASFMNGYCCVKKGNRYGFISKSGKYIIMPKYKIAQNFGTNWSSKRLYALVGNKKQFLINTKGKKIKEVSYYSDDTGDIHEWGYIIKNRRREK
jgi:hypothetical protein